ncbi:hypothetical protein [Rothia sp. HMSC061C12]|jgi:thiamine biosynthesis ATP pyrophosphatase|uniref:hypothetical protein n=1 Tax=Rothia sp. HMSC061C12 TaxID=1739547 RepID=UPI0008A5BB39|nr:hypothetical protein [Rothia sp. HMSC061C12]OFO19185.1 hypothetical protein HMPREF3055_03660 [Rothia sp. HMSC061C12]
MMSQESAITFWGVCSIITTIFTLFTLAAYIVNRRRDEKKKREGIYISRLQALLAYIIVFFPGFPLVCYSLSLERAETSTFMEVACILMAAFLLFYLWHVNATYMKISSEGINMHTPVLGSRICPIGAIDSVVYSESKNEDTPSRMWFLTKSGARINPLNPNYDEYYLLLMTRFRIKYGRWPELDNPADVDKVNQLDNRYEVIPYFMNNQEISGLADVDM